MTSVFDPPDRSESSSEDRVIARFGGEARGGEAGGSEAKEETSLASSPAPSTQLGERFAHENGKARRRRTRKPVCR